MVFLLVRPYQGTERAENKNQNVKTVWNRRKKMAAWLTAHLATVLICLVLAAIVVLILLSLIRDRKKGKSSCGCGCGGCPMNGSCRQKK